MDPLFAIFATGEEIGEMLNIEGEGDFVRSFLVVSLGFGGTFLEGDFRGHN